MHAGEKRHLRVLIQAEAQWLPNSMALRIQTNDFVKEHFGFAASAVVQNSLDVVHDLSLELLVPPFLLQAMSQKCMDAKLKSPSRH